MRPDWDQYFMAFARVAATRGTCDRLQVGAVTMHDNRVLTTGYNGAPSKWPDCDTEGHQLVKIGERESCVRTIHAEENAILQAAVMGISLKDATIYTTASPCYDCLKRICQVGIWRVIYAAPYTSARSSGLSVVELAHKSGIEMIYSPVSPIE